MVRRPAAVRAALADPAGTQHPADRLHAGLSRSTACGWAHPFHRTYVAGVVCPRLLGRRAGADVAERMDAMGAPQSSLYRRQLCGLARASMWSRSSPLLCTGASRRPLGGDLACVRHLRRHLGYAVKRAMTATLFRPHGNRVSGACAWRRLHIAGGSSPAVEVHGAVRQAVVPNMPLYALFLIPPLAALVLLDDGHGAVGRKPRAQNKPTRPPSGDTPVSVGDALT